MPYAAQNRLAQEWFEGSIEITDEQWQQGIEAMTTGKWVLIEPDGFRISDPIPDPVPEPTDEDIEATQRNKLLMLNTLAASQKSALLNRIGVINDAIDFGEATDAEVAELPTRSAQLVDWKRYAVLLGRVTSQAGWYKEINWPEQPTEGMDLSTDPVGRAS